LILAHRYLGIVLGPLFLLWFSSGIAMVYLRGMPELNAEQRLAHLPQLDAATIRIGPSAASRVAGVGNHPGRFILTTVMGRPAYRIGVPPITVFADTGERLEQVGEATAITIASRFLAVPDGQIRHRGLLTDPDQWTLAHRRQLPLHKLVASDSANTHVYVSDRLGEVVNLTTARSRTLAWISAIPHWLYFKSLRVNDRVWRHVILWSTAIATISAVIGLILAVIQSSVSYRGWLRWHYRAGVIFGVTTVTWVFSGLLSMEPWFWARSDGFDTPGAKIAATLAGGRLDLAAFPDVDATWAPTMRAVDAREVEFVRVHGEPHLVIYSAGSVRHLLNATSLTKRPAPMSPESLLATFTAAIPDTPIAEATLIDRYDAYYYARDPLPLPVLRVKLDDNEHTWVYVDPIMRRVAGQLTRRERVQRWVYHGLHSLDFPWLYDRRPLWDLVVITLCLGGAALSAIGVVIGAKRVLRRQ
jgi:hypothetical protein